MLRAADTLLNALFQSTLPARGATFRVDGFVGVAEISIHAPRTGSDDGRRHPAVTLGISIHAPRTRSDKMIQQQREWRAISIHAPRTGSDGQAGAADAAGHPISIHAPRTGSDYREDG